MPVSRTPESDPIPTHPLPGTFYWYCTYRLLTCMEYLTYALMHESHMYYVSIIDPPKITRNPTCQPKRIHEEAVLIVKASGSGTLSYSWIKDGTPITDETQFGCTGVTSNSLRFASLLPEHGGKYKCIVSCGGHNIDSKIVEVQGK